MYLVRLQSFAFGSLRLFLLLSRTSVSGVRDMLLDASVSGFILVVIDGNF